MYARFFYVAPVVALVVSLASAGCSTVSPIDSWTQTQRATAPRTISGETGVDIETVSPEEVDLVEAVVKNREAYRKNLKRLHDYYSEHGYATKQGWAAYEMDGLSKVKPFRYLLDAEVPAAALTAKDSIPEADKLYEKGRELMRRGGYGIPAVYREDRMIQAAEVFRDLIRRYPTSDKIDDAAYLCGEIHSEYLPGTDMIAVKWYERCWTWDPATPYDAKYKAATIYDYRLHDRATALELYHQVVDEQRDKRHARQAQARIAELTGVDDVQQAAMRAGQ